MFYGPRLRIAARGKRENLWTTRVLYPDNSAWTHPVGPYIVEHNSRLIVYQTPPVSEWQHIRKPIVLTWRQYLQALFCTVISIVFCVHYVTAVVISKYLRGKLLSFHICGTGAATNTEQCRVANQSRHFRPSRPTTHVNLWQLRRICMYVWL